MYKLFLNDFTGSYLKCDFVDGVATTDDERIVNYFKRHNYKYEEIKIENVEKAETKAEPKTSTKTTKTKKTKKTE